MVPLDTRHRLGRSCFRTRICPQAPGAIDGEVQFLGDDKSINNAPLTGKFCGDPDRQLLAALSPSSEARSTWTKPKHAPLRIRAPYLVRRTRGAERVSPGRAPLAAVPQRGVCFVVRKVRVRLRTDVPVLPS
jgi:hypothetical protein